MLTTTQQYLADDLFRIGAIKIDTEVGYRLKAHDDHSEWPLSPIYLNLRTDQHPVPEKRGPLTRMEMMWIGNEFYCALKQKPNVEFDLFVDIPEAGTPFGDQIEKEFHSKPRLKLHKWEMLDGSRRIVGLEEIKKLPGDNRVLLVDDLVSGADTKLEAIKVLEHADYTIAAILVLVDRCQGGTEELERLGYKVIAVMKLPDMLDYYVESGKITPEVRDIVLERLQLLAKLQAAS
jgi:orotate phosphoribosyltransferase